MEVDATPSPFPPPIAGPECLDFANTVGPRRPEPGQEQRDYIPGYTELVAWAAERGLVTRAQQQRLTAAAEADPQAATAAYQDARRLRDAIYETFAAVAAGGSAPSTTLAAIQHAYVEALRNAQLGGIHDGLGWRWPESDALEQVLWPIAHSAVELMTSRQLARIKVCPGDDGQCGWLFLDTSKNATRRWCSMRTCGSRVKSQRQAARLRAARAAR